MNQSKFKSIRQIIFASVIAVGIVGCNSEPTADSGSSANKPSAGGEAPTGAGTQAAK